MLKKLLSLIVIVCFFLTTLTPYPQAHADDSVGLPLDLPAPGTMVDLSPAYQPVIIRGLTVHPENPFQFDFIIDTGNLNLTEEQLKAESTRLVKYFLASLTVPEKNLWVNLSPYEKDRIIPETLGVTAMGRDMLAEDYILKQLTASLVYPEKALGKSFWSRTYQMAKEKYGTTDIPINTFNKVWVIPKSATVYEHNGSAFVVDSHLTVMLDEDYLSLEKHLNSSNFNQFNTHDAKQVSGATSQVVREVLIPEIEKEVNSGKNFANLRQIYNSMILAIWYKQNLKLALLNQAYSDRSKTKGIELQDKTFKQMIYERYLAAFKKGVYNYIKEDKIPYSFGSSQGGQTIARKYFSGGVVSPDHVRGITDLAMLPPKDLADLEILRNLHNVSVQFGEIGIKDSASIAIQLKSKTPEERLQEIRRASNKGYDQVGSDKNIPPEVQQLLTFYDELPDFQNEHNPARIIIKAGQLRAGPDPEHIIDAEHDEQGYLISTHEHNNAAKELLIKLTPELEKKFDEWQSSADKTNTGIDQIAPFSAGIIVTTVQAFEKYGILDLFKKEGTITVGEIISHVNALPEQGFYHDPSREQIHKDLRIFTMLGWVVREGNESPDDNTKYTVTAIGREAFEQADLYGKVANFMLEFPRITDYLYDRENAPKLKEGAPSLRELLELSKNGWGLPDNMDANLKWVITDQLNGYLYMNLLLAFYYEDPEFSQGDIDIDQLKTDLQNPLHQTQNEILLKIFGISSEQIDQLTEEAAIKGFNKLLRNFDPQKIPDHDRILLPLEMQGLLEKGNLTYRNKIRTNSAYLKAGYSNAIRKKRGGIFNFFDSNSEISINRIKELKYITGNTGELESALDFFVHLKFLNKNEETETYKLTANGSFALFKPLMFGVTVSYRPMVDHTEEILFNSLVLGEDGVYRDLNVEGSGFTHPVYFDALTNFIKIDIENYIAAGKIPSIRTLKSRIKRRSFVLEFNDMGVGDATFLSNLYHFIVNHTKYGELMREYPEFYKLEMDGQDFYPAPRDISKARLDTEGIPNIIMFGDVGKMVEARTKMIAALVEKYPNAQIMTNLTSTFLYHNRPGEDAPYGEPLLTTGKFNSTAVFAWGGELKTYAQFEDNLIRFKKSLVQPILMPDRFIKEGRVYGIDLYTPFAHLIAQGISNGRKRVIIAVPYAWHHGKSLQHMVEYENAKNAREAAGVETVDFKLFPPVKGGVNVEVMVLQAKSQAMITNPSIPASSKVDGGINFDPAMLQFQIKRDNNGMPLSFSQQPFSNIRIDGLSLRIIKITDVNVPALLDLKNTLTVS